MCEDYKETPQILISHEEPKDINANNLELLQKQIQNYDYSYDPVFFFEEVFLQSFVKLTNEEIDSFLESNQAIRLFNILLETNQQELENFVEAIGNSTKLTTFLANNMEIIINSIEKFNLIYKTYGKYFYKNDLILSDVFFIDFFNQLFDNGIDYDDIRDYYFIASIYKSKLEIEPTKIYDIIIHTKFTSIKFELLNLMVSKNLIEYIEPKIYLLSCIDVICYDSSIFLKYKENWKKFTTECEIELNENDKEKINNIIVNTLTSDIEFIYKQVLYLLLKGIYCMSALDFIPKEFMDDIVKCICDPPKRKHAFLFNFIRSENLILDYKSELLLSQIETMINTNS